jgi:hypothetical protein
LERLLRRNLEGTLDLAALTASAVCTVHCLLLPVLLATTPALSRWLDLGEGFHVGILLFAIPTSAVALGSGWRRSGNPTALVLGGLGLCIMAHGLLIANEASETTATLIGSGLLAIAHVRNWVLRQRCA